MRTIFIIRGLILCLLLSLFWFETSATHIRAGEIAVVKASSNGNLYRITLTVYRDTDGIDFKLGTLEFGDGQSIENFTDEGDPSNPDDDFLLEDKREIVGEKLEKLVFETIHEYIATSGTFKVSFIEENRNEGILNIASSVNTPFYIESQFRIDNLTGQNSSPILTIPPVDLGVQGALYIHNPGAFDRDNDSLSFELITPLRNRNENQTITVAGYRPPNTSEFYGADFATGNSDRNGPPTFSIDPFTGNIIWDAPGEPGEYNIAFRVTEHRKIGGVFQEIGYVVRDMQITIEKSDNNPPEIEAIGPLCIDAGDIGRNFAVATDPDGDSIAMEAFGEPFDVDFPATFFPGKHIFQPTPGVARLDFEWQTDCIHAREDVYEVLVKAQDNGAPPLVDLESFTVQVAAPAPTGVMASLTNSLNTLLQWDDYTCKANYDMQIWRREGTFDFTPDDCETGIPDGEYQMIELITDKANTFNDQTISAGKTYCYRIVADYRGGLGAGLSYASDEVCIETELVQPLVLNVDVLKDPIGLDNGEVFLKWQSPIDLDTNLFQRPFTYLVYNTNNRNEPLFDTPSLDTTFTVMNVDLVATRPSYYVEAYDPSGTVLYATSEQASTIDLDIDQIGRDSRLTFDGQVPWNINNQTHLIFRNRIDPNNDDLLVLIDSTNAFSYIDTLPQEKETEYCYYVTTRGQYENEDIERPLINKSQTTCAFISDVVNTCIPQLLPLPDCKTQLASMPCQVDQYATSLQWTVPEGPNECLDIKEFVVLFSPNCDDVYDTLRPENPNATSFEYIGNKGLQGCYKVASINFLGIEGISNLEEKDGRGCQNIKLPNVFTPNGDGVNDLYNPFNDFTDDIFSIDCPRFVKSLDFRVYDRTGNQLFTFKSKEGQPFLNQNDVLINWDGKNKAGNELPTGVYYYGADVIFYNFEQEHIKDKRKGWIKLTK